VRHQRHYTLDEAAALRGWVAERVREARAALDVLIAPESRAAMAALDPNGGGGWPGREVAAATLRFQRSVAELHGADIVVRDLGRGLVDFPAIRDGVEIYLCWLVDEDEIRFWHELDAGFAGRRPLEGPG
jgi:hypothetical protein